MLNEGVQKNIKVAVLKTQFARHGPESAVKAFSFYFLKSNLIILISLCGHKLVWVVCMHTLS